MTEQFDIVEIETFNTYEEVVEYLRKHSEHLKANPQDIIQVMTQMAYCSTLQTLDFIVNELKFDVNTKGRWTSEGATTLIDFACELRRDDILAEALKYGAKITDETLETLLFGHGHDCQYRVEDCESCLRILDDAGVPRIIHRYVLEEICGEYIENSPYMKEFLASCELIDD